MSMKDLKHSFAPTILRLALGGISLFNAAHILRLVGPSTDAIEGPTEAVRMYSDRLAAAGIPAAVPLTWVLLVMMIVGGMCVLLGYQTRIAAIALCLVYVMGLITGPSLWLLGEVDRAARLGAEVCIFAFAICVVLMMTGGGSLSLKQEP
jgi:uncharacterized membrane protein YphA (DoxX/SURF4 family)